jgi:hypothetical protein
MWFAPREIYKINLFESVVAIDRAAKPSQNDSRGKRQVDAVWASFFDWRSRY